MCELYIYIVCVIKKKDFRQWFLFDYTFMGEHLFFQGSCTQITQTAKGLKVMEERKVV